MPLGPCRGRARATGLIVVCAFSLAGCATFSDTFGVIESHLAAGQFDQALEALERQSHRSRDRVLYLLNKAMLQRMRGDYAASNQAFEEAKTLMNQLYGASISEHTLSFVINDATRSYTGEEYEQVLVHLYAALNYLEMGDPGAARVEALQVDVKLREVAERLPDSYYAEDAFARYLTGLIYEDLGEWSDALIAYRKAYEAYTKQQPHTYVDVPPFLKYDLLRLTERQGLTAEMEKYKAKFDIDQWPGAREQEQLGEVVFILQNGLAPILREQSSAVVDPGSGHLIRISLPYFESRPSPVTDVQLSAGEHRSTAALVENIDAIARSHLQAKMPAITARTIARQVVKSKIAKEARRSAGQQSDSKDALAAAIFSIGVEIAGFITERADTRSWVTLPRDIYLARLALPPGQHTVRVELYGGLDRLVAVRDYPGVDIRRGRKTFLSQYWIPPNLPGRRR